MQKCPELSKLPKAPAVRSLNFKRQTPGCISRVSFHPSEPPLDSSHPAAQSKRGLFPVFKSNALTINAYPYAVLGKPERIWTEPFDRPFETWQQRVKRTMTASRHQQPNGSDRAHQLSEGAPVSEDFSLPPMVLSNDRNGRVSMSFLTVANKKKIGKTKRNVRVRLTRKMKTAVSHVITRGARTTEVNGKRTIVFSEASQPEENNWVLRGWSYAFVPSLEVYMMPYQDLIPLMRSAMRAIWEQGMAMEARWEKVTPSSSRISKRKSSTREFTMRINERALRASRLTDEEAEKWMEEHVRHGVGNPAELIRSAGGDGLAAVEKAVKASQDQDMRKVRERLAKKTFVIKSGSKGRPSPGES
ncbi:hypothetical protein BDN72DRAFT_831845 [Pluteus cervinus]|uniref:Uncharacterized protein n=1 Tax=Pluteus cervinus TaxID=181527 RepID=A0ACD3BCJ7_9AGAR|nr:hypothetical protein BDN72DRAFT_831845 [Pluteus cervinus]